MDTIKKLLIIRLSSLGDILLTTPLIRSLKKKYPDAEIDFLVREEYKGIVELNPHISKLIIFSKEKEATAKLKEQISKSGYELILDLQNNLRTKKLTSGLQSAVFRFYKNSAKKFLLVNLKINLLKHASPIPVRYAQSVPGFTLDEEGLEIFLPDKFTEVKPDKNIVGFCPGSRHYTKMWPKEYFIELGNLLAKKGKIIHLIGGRSDMEICNEISSKIPCSQNLSNSDDLFLTASELKKCGSVVCNDSGLMHLACAVKTPVLAVFGSTVREFGFAPYKNKNLILENNSLSCRPCSHIGRNNCPKRHFKCMTEITPALACEKLEELLYI